MKKTLFFICCAAALAACSSAPKSVDINAVPEKQTSAITSADRTCTEAA